MLTINRENLFEAAFVWKKDDEIAFLVAVISFDIPKCHVWQN